ncbi:MAG: tetratricopeptide repeat protein [Planctomycetota bacterium]
MSAWMIPGSSRARFVLALALATTAGLVGCEPTPTVEVPDTVTEGTQAPVAEVLQRARKAVIDNPQSFERWFELASLLDAHDQQQEAIVCYERCLQIDASHLPSRYHYGNCLELVGRPEDAKKAFEAVAAADPNYAPVHFRLGELYYREGQNDLAQEQFERHLRLKDTLYGRVRLGQISIAQGQLADGIAHLERVRQALPRNRTVLAALAQGYARAGRAEDARVVNAQLVAGEVVNDGLSLPDPLRFAVASKAVDSRSCLDRAELHEAANQWSEALVDLEMAARGSPNSAQIRDRIGRAYIRTGQYETAIAHFDRALGLDFGYSNSYHNRGVAQLALGRRQEAIQDFRRTLKLDPDHTHARQQLQKLGIEP